jgi:hypothetical protein
MIQNQKIIRGKIGVTKLAKAAVAAGRVRRPLSDNDRYPALRSVIAANLSRGSRSAMLWQLG